MSSRVAVIPDPIQEPDPDPEPEPEVFRFCGDGFRNLKSEQCDDGNTRSGDGCSSTCRIERDRATTPIVRRPKDQREPPNVPSYCGDGILDDGEECEDSNSRDGDGCSSDCTLLIAAVRLRCGDGILHGSEECEDGNGRNGDGCDAKCRLEERVVAAAGVCGDGGLDTGEECDDSNRRDGDGCSSTCLLEVGICGDGVIQSLLGEQCEASLHDPALPYDCVNCRFLSKFCGDENVDPGEECDDGTRNSTSPDARCRPDCSLGRCGDGVVDSAETCDDGNRLSGDGCDRYCRTEIADVIEPEVVANQNEIIIDAIASAPLQPTSYNLPPHFPFPQQPTFQQLPMQLPLGQLQPLIAQRAPAGDTGPAAVAVIGAGAAAGMGWIRRRRRK